jgi:uncharacterized protein
LIRRQLATFVEGDHDALGHTHYPEPVEHCDVCVWSSVCREKRRVDDHLSLVAGITRLQRRELVGQSIDTLARLAVEPLPLRFKPRRGSLDSYTRAREQARLQLEARTTERPAFELLPVEVGMGLSRLPEPSRGDLFLDLEGDPFAGVQGREYLFGLASLDDEGQPVYRGRWALTAADEAVAFDEMVGVVMRSWAACPDMHVYHYAPYEPAALKRLMGRFARHERDVDDLLRGGRFVDLYAVVRQGVRAGIERYSIKALEPLYGFTRQVPLVEASRSLRVMEQALELDLPDLVTPEVRSAIERYNEDDCLSALRLRNWLESLRAGLEADGHPVGRPPQKEIEASKNVTERELRVAALRSPLLEGVPFDVKARDASQHARWLVAFLLDWHRREEKADWWEYFRLRDLPDEDLLDEPRAIAGLEYVERVEIVTSKKGKPTGSVVDRYRYPVQEMELRRQDELKLRTEEKLGEVVQVERAAHTLDIRKGRKAADVHPTSAFEHRYVNLEVLEDAIFAIGEGVVRNHADRLANRLLRAEPPVVASGFFAHLPNESAVDCGVRTAGELTESILAIQGPPGTGKTYTGARMICALVAAGKRVGVTATGHRVIRNLLDAVARVAAERGQGDVCLGHKVDDPDAEPGHVWQTDSNDAACDALVGGSVNVFGGTAWLWARPQFAKSVDVLFVDEAGQMSLANALAVTQAARSVVLLGDPQQLEQPLKGTHPEGIGISALQHMLGPHITIPPGRGIFLPDTWRLAPSIAAFTSELFYEGRLQSKPGLERQRLVGNRFESASLWLVEARHQGNRNASDEEVDVVERLSSELLAAESRWIDEGGTERAMEGSDVLVVAPFNAQVARLAERIERLGVRIGTVDKFQGQEAPVQLANALCRYREMAAVVAM